MQQVNHFTGWKFFPESPCGFLIMALAGLVQEQVTLLFYALVPFSDSAQSLKMSFAWLKRKPGRPRVPYTSPGATEKASELSALPSSSISASPTASFPLGNALLKSAANSKSVPQCILQLPSLGRLNKTSQRCLRTLRLCAAPPRAA